VIVGGGQLGEAIVAHLEDRAHQCGVWQVWQFLQIGSTAIHDQAIYLPLNPADAAIVALPIRRFVLTGVVVGANHRLVAHQ